MDRKEKVLTVEKEFMWIKNKNIRKFAIDMVSILPDYFFVVPASSTGKYHPEYSLGEGGLVRHTKSAVLIAKTLLDLDRLPTQKELREFFLANDWSARKPYDFDKWSQEKIYEKL